VTRSGRIRELSGQACREAPAAVGEGWRVPVSGRAPDALLRRRSRAFPVEGAAAGRPFTGPPDGAGVPGANAVYTGPSAVPRGRDVGAAGTVGTRGAGNADRVRGHG